MPDYAEFKELFPKLVYAENVSQQKRLIKYVLQRMNSHVASPSVTDYEQMTIEHIVPQSLVGKNGRTDSIVGQIGDLLLVSPELNKSLEDRPFREKKKILSAAGFALPKEIADATAWAPADIAARTALLAKKAYDVVWKI